jgi:ankyrin repeat protein
MHHWSRSMGIICLTVSVVVVDLRAGEIHNAASVGDLNKVRALMAADPSLVESRDERDRTPLDCACIRNRVAVANFLLDHNANVNVRNYWGQTPLHSANGVFGQDYDLIKRLIAKGADVNARGGRGDSPLSWATARGNLKVVRLLIDSGADLNAYDAAFGTILHNVIGQNSTEMAKLLIESGAKLNQADPSGRTELHLAAISGHADLVQLLIERGADLEATDRHDHTALYYAAKHSHRSAANVLTAKGANQDAIIEANYGKAPQLIAPLREGEAHIWYLGGFASDAYAVKTQGHLLVFDPPGIDEGPEAGLANGRLNPAELAGQKIIVVITKPDWERYPLVVFELAGRMEDVEIVISYKPEAKLTSQGPVPPLPSGRAQQASFHLWRYGPHNSSDAGRRQLSRRGRRPEDLPRRISRLQ